MSPFDPRANRMRCKSPDVRPRVSVPDWPLDAAGVAVRRTTGASRPQLRAHHQARIFSPSIAGAPRRYLGNSARAAGPLSIAKTLLQHRERRDNGSRPTSAHIASHRPLVWYPPILPPSAETAVLAAISQRRHSEESKQLSTRCSLLPEIPRLFSRRLIVTARFKFGRPLTASDRASNRNVCEFS